MDSPTLPSQRFSTLALALVLLSLPVLGGCGTFLSLLKINPDGSGTIEQTTRLNAMAADFMSSMSSMGDSTGQGENATAEMFSEEQVRARAEQLGESVRFVRMERLGKGGGRGYRAVYAFDDVRDVRLSLDDQMDLDDDAGADAEGDGSSPITFDFEAGAPATLTMHLGGLTNMEGSSEMGGDRGGSASDTSNVAQQMMMMRMMFQDARMGVSVEPQGTLVSTDATHHDDGRVTLMEMNFNEMMADRKAFKQFLQAESQDLSEAEREQMMQEMPGVRAETSETVTMRFQ